jgi:hypothetical protein
VNETIEQLEAVRRELECQGFASISVMRQPEWCIRRLATTQRETDWRDAFMAALAGGESSTGATAVADVAVDILQARRTKETA